MGVFRRRKGFKVESFTPRELDIPFPEIARINIGECPGTGTHHEEVGPHKAHTHLCSKDIYYKNICIIKEYLFNSDNSISDILWHEYAHVLDTINFEHVEVASCNFRGLHEYVFANMDDSHVLDSYGHGPTWKRIMERLGKKPTRIENKPY